MENQQELMMKFQMFEQQAQQIQQQLQAVEQSAIELSNLNLGLNELVGAEGKEIKAPMGRGIFVKAKLLSEDLLVDVGNKNLITKSIPETKELISNQIKKLEEIRVQLDNAMEQMNSDLTKMIMEAQGNEKDSGEKKRSCENKKGKKEDEGCECEEKECCKCG